jgi:hypothetical protein
MGFQKIATGNNFVIAILDGGLVTVFGTNQEVKSKYFLIEDGVDVFAADDVAFVTLSTGTLVGFGSDRNQRLPIPVEIKDAKQVCITPDYVLCLEKDGTLKSWGVGTPAIPNEIMASKITSVSNQLYDVTVTLENGQTVQWNLRG